MTAADYPRPITVADKRFIVTMVVRDADEARSRMEQICIDIESNAVATYIASDPPYSLLSITVDAARANEEET